MFGPTFVKKERIISRPKYENLKGNLFFIGSKNIGKSSILRSYLKENSFYFDFERISMSPELFVVEIIENVCFSLKKISSWQEILKNNSFLPEKAVSIIKQVQNELEKIKPDQRFLVKAAFDFFNSLGKKVIVVFDEFLEILGLNNYEQITNVIDIFNSADKENVQYILSSSSVFLSQQIKLKNFQIINIDPLTKEETSSLLLKIGKFHQKTIDDIFILSQGIPLYAYAIGKRYSEVKNVRKAYVIETLSKNGLLFNSCLQQFNDSLSRARGKTLLKVLLKKLASHDELRLNEISKLIYKSSPVTNSLLLRLIEVDLISKKDAKFSIADSVLGFWAKHYLSGISFEDLDEKMVEELAKEAVK